MGFGLELSLMSLDDRVRPLEGGTTARAGYGVRFLEGFRPVG